MAFKLADLVKETTTVADGTSNYDLTAISGYQQFGDVLSDGDTTYYAITDGAGKWEVGIGTYDGTNDELDRADGDVIASSNSNNRVVWGSGDKEIYITYPANKAAVLTGGGQDQVFFENDQTVTTDYTITSGKNAMSAGDITIDTGATVTIPSGSNWTVV